MSVFILGPTTNTNDFPTASCWQVPERTICYRHWLMSRVDFVPYPPTSFPFRDLLVLEQLPLTRSDTVCEIGVGSGGTTARLAKICAKVTGFEISHDTVAQLRY